MPKRHGADVLLPQNAKTKLFLEPRTVVVAVSYTHLDVDKRQVLASLRQGIFFMPMLVILPAFMGVDGVAVSHRTLSSLSYLLTAPSC